jgi:transcriptional regulator with XRE-family HTH domain
VPCNVEMKNAPEIEKVLGEAIRARRLTNGWSQEELSFESGLHRTYIGAVERGEKNLTVKNLVRIAIALDIPASTLMLNAKL